MTTKKILVAGHGGQGVLVLGDFLAYTAMLQDKHVAYTPSYGPEARGGKVRCYVVTSDHQIDSPIVEEPSVLIVMNQPSMDFETSLAPGGLLIYNSSLIDRQPLRSDIRKVPVPVTEFADSIKDDLTEEELGGVKDTRMLANSVMFGAFVQMCEPDLPESTVREMLEHFMETRLQMIRLNTVAMKKGREFVKSKRHLRDVIRACDLLPAWAAQ